MYGRPVDNVMFTRNYPTMGEFRLNDVTLSSSSSMCVPNSYGLWNVGSVRDGSHHGATGSAIARALYDL